MLLIFDITLLLKKARKFGQFRLVQKIGFEPTRTYRPQVPETCASANSAIPAYKVF